MRRGMDLLRISAPIASVLLDLTTYGFVLTILVRVLTEISLELTGNPHQLL